MTGRLLILDQFSELGGAQRCLLDLLPALRDAGYELHLALPGDGPLAEGARRHRAVAHSIACGPYNSGRKRLVDYARLGVEIPLQARSIRSLVRRHEIDLIYVNGPRLLPAAALAHGHCPVLFHAHSALSGPAASLARWALRRSGATVIAACRFVLQPLSLPAAASVHVIYNGIPEVPCIREARREGDPWRIGVIGRIAPEKGQLEFVRAVRWVMGAAANCRFIVCGEALFSSPEYGKRVRAEAKGLPVEFTGWRDDIASVLANLDLLVVPSAPVDATPRVILEAFSAGVPVLAFRSGGIPEIVDDGRTGVLVRGTSEALASKLIELLNRGQPYLESLAAAAREAYAAKYSVERWWRDVLSVVRSASTGQPRQSPRQN